MSRILAKGFNHYAVVYDLTCRMLKDNIMGHLSAPWKMMEECFIGICNIGGGINELRAIEEPNSTHQMHHIALR